MSTALASGLKDTVERRFSLEGSCRAFEHSYRFQPGFARMPRSIFLTFSALGTTLWTVALAFAGVALRSNFERIGDYVNMVTNVLLAGFVALMIKRYVQCWRARTAEPSQPT